MAVNGIYGLSGSGMDIDSMVKVGMLTKQNQYDKMYKTNTKNEWMKEAYSNVYSDMNKFAMTTLSDFKMSSFTSPMTVSTSNSGVVTATANADAAQMAHTVEVESLASNAYLMTTDHVQRAKENAVGFSLKDVIFSETEQAELLAKINSGELDGDETAVSFHVSLGENATASLDAEGNPMPTETTLSFSYKDLLTSEQTLNDLADVFNQSGIGLKASYDATNDSFSIYQKNGGSNNQIVLTLNDTDSDDVKGYAAKLLDNLHLGKVTQTSTTTGLSSVISDPLTVAGGIKAEGTDGLVKVDGKEYKTATSKISVGNVQYSLLATGKSTVNISQDTDKLVDNVKTFVEEYNKMMDSLIAKYNETQYKDYGVLTKAQEEGMTQEQITKWNEKAKSGLLYHDQRLSKLMTQIREAFYTPVEGTGSHYNTMMSIGISSSTDQGHIKLDEDKLRKALAADPDCVRKIFASTGDVNVNGKLETDYSREGVLNRMQDKIFSNLKDLKSYAGESSSAEDGSALGKMIMDMRTKMSDFKTMMNAYETKLYAKYDAMEQAIARMSGMYNYIMGGN